MKFHKYKRQAGFSLIEIAIVLVIIGLLIGGVLKGQTMVKNSKIKRIATDTSSAQGAINGYMDSFWSLPGDDANAASRFTGIAPGVGDGNGIIDAAASATAELFNPANPATDETALIWNHLYCADLVKGRCVAAGTAVTLPTNPMGGITGIADGHATASAAPTTPVPVLGINTKVICMEKIPGDYASIYDSQFDDGIGTTGQIRGSANMEVASTPGVATDYTGTAIIHICTGF